MAAPTRAPRDVKLLLDEMHAPRIAQTLTEEGWDVVATATDPGLRVLSDADLLVYATRAGRSVVTENIADFSILANLWAGDGRDHAGIVFTNPNRFNRASLAYPTNLVRALQDLLEESTAPGTSWIGWL